ERGNGRAHVAKQLNSRFNNVCDRTDGIGIYDAMIAWVWLGQTGKLAAGFPIEVAAVHNNAADGCSVSADEFSSRMDDNIGPVLDWPQQVRAWERIVDDERQPVFMGN